ncbi:MAG: hypothetical protein AB7N71_06850, partial [Phycisphaerae bacterium]
NGRLDACDITMDATPDCNKNGIPDECDLSSAVFRESPQLSPIGAGAPQAYLFTSLPEAVGDVRITIDGRGDFNISAEFVAVSVNEVALGNAFVIGSDCSTLPLSEMFMLSANEFNSLLKQEAAAFSFIASALVDETLCQPASHVRVRLEYDSVSGGSEDGNQNGVPDECEQLVGDLNCDGVLSVSDIGPFVLALTDAAGYAVQFPDCNIQLADTNGDQTISVSDIGPFVTLLQN